MTQLVSGLIDYRIGPAGEARSLDFVLENHKASCTRGGDFGGAPWESTAPLPHVGKS